MPKDGNNERIATISRKTKETSIRLSLGLDYPNDSDRKRADGDLGGVAGGPVAPSRCGRIGRGHDILLSLRLVALSWQTCARRLITARPGFPPQGLRAGGGLCGDQLV